MSGDSDESCIHYETLEKTGYVLIEEYDSEADKGEPEDDEEDTAYYVSLT